MALSWFLAFYSGFSGRSKTSESKLNLFLPYPPCRSVLLFAKKEQTSVHRYPRMNNRDSHLLRERSHARPTDAPQVSLPQCHHNGSPVLSRLSGIDHRAFYGRVKVIESITHWIVFHHSSLALYRSVTLFAKRANIVPSLTQGIHNGSLLL